MTVWILLALVGLFASTTIAAVREWRGRRPAQVPPIEAARSALFALGAWPPTLEPDARRALHDDLSRSRSLVTDSNR